MFGYIWAVLSRVFLSFAIASTIKTRCFEHKILIKFSCWHDKRRGNANTTSSRPQRSRIHGRTSTPSNPQRLQCHGPHSQHSFFRSTSVVVCLDSEWQAASAVAMGNVGVQGLLCRLFGGCANHGLDSCFSEFAYVLLSPWACMISDITAPIASHPNFPFYRNLLNNGWIPDRLVVRSSRLNFVCVTLG